METKTFYSPIDIYKNTVENKNNFQKLYTALNPKKIAKFGAISGLIGAAYHLGSLTILDPFTSLSMGATSYLGGKIGFNLNDVAKSEIIKKSENLVDENEKNKLISDVSYINNLKSEINDTSIKTALALTSIIGYGVYQASTVGGAISNGMVDIAMATIIGGAFWAAGIMVKSNENIEKLVEEE